MTNLDTHELSWAAGFFDGEGSVCLRRRGNWMELWFQVPQSGDTEALERFQSAIGGLGKIRGPWVYRERMLPMYRLDLRGYREVQAAIAMLWRFLSGPKKRQAELAMSKCKEYFRKRSLHGRGPARLTLRQVNDLRERYALAKVGRLRAPRGWIKAEALALDLSYHTIAPILQGRGYVYQTNTCS